MRWLLHFFCACRCLYYGWYLRPRNVAARQQNPPSHRIFCSDTFLGVSYLFLHRSCIFLLVCATKPYSLVSHNFQFLHCSASFSKIIETSGKWTERNMESCDSPPSRASIDFPKKCMTLENLCCALIGYAQHAICIFWVHGAIVTR